MLLNRAGRCFAIGTFSAMLGRAHIFYEVLLRPSSSCAELNSQTFVLLRMCDHSVCLDRRDCIIGERTHFSMMNASIFVSASSVVGCNQHAVCLPTQALVPVIAGAALWITTYWYKGHGSRTDSPTLMRRVDVALALSLKDERSEFPFRL